MKSLSITGNDLVPNNVYKNTFKYNFPNGSVTFKNMEIAVAKVSVWYSFYTISEAQKNNKFSYYWPSSTGFMTNPSPVVGLSTKAFQVTIPDGTYSISQLNSFLQYTFIQNKHYMIDGSGNYVYFIELLENPTKNLTELICYPISVALTSTYTQPVGATWTVPVTAQTPVFEIYPYTYDVPSDIYYDCSNGSPLLTNMTSTSKLVVGQRITGTNIPASTRILSIDSSTQITISNNATGNSTQVLASFGATPTSYFGRMIGFYASTNAIATSDSTADNLVDQLNNMPRFYPPNQTPYNPTPTPTQTSTYNKLGQFNDHTLQLTTLKLACSLLSNNLALPNTLLYSLSVANTDYGSIIQHVPATYGFIPIMDGIYNDFTISFLDQNNQPIYMRDSDVDILLMIRKC
jgi:hypothetical protein